MHVQTPYKQGVPAVTVTSSLPSLPCSDSQPADSPRFLMDGLGTKHRVWFQRFGTSLMLVLEKLKM